MAPAILNDSLPNDAPHSTEEGQDYVFSLPQVLTACHKLVAPFSDGVFVTKCEKREEVKSRR
jgi:hypothetical protein